MRRAPLAFITAVSLNVNKALESINPCLLTHNRAQ